MEGWMAVLLGHWRRAALPATMAHDEPLLTSTCSQSLAVLPPLPLHLIWPPSCHWRGTGTAVQLRLRSGQRQGGSGPVLVRNVTPAMHVLCS